MIRMQTRSAQQVQRAAESLTSVCYEKTLRDIYKDVVDEPLPRDIQDLLDKLQ